MSYDLRFSVKVADTDDLFVTFETPEYDTPTYNLGQMFRACTGWDYNQGERYLVSDVIDKIEHGIKELHTKRKEYEKYNSPNGWGTIDGAIESLESLRDKAYEIAEDIPMDKFYVSW